MKRGLLRSAMLTLLLAGAGWAAQAPRPRSAPSPAPAGDVIATVGSTRILRAEFDARAEQALAEYRRRTGTELSDDLKPLVRRQLLERLIQRNLLILESKRLGIAPTDAEAEEMIRQDPFFQEGGRFNAAKYEALKNSNPVMFRNALEQARENLAARRLNDRIESRSRPDDRALRERVARGLGRTSIEYLALRRRDFAGTAPEPRESDVLGYYRSHLAEFQRPDHAVLTILLVNQGIGDSLARAPGGVAAWEKELRERADSTLRAVRGGARLEEVARGFGGVRANVTVEPGHFPPYWRDDAHQSAGVFSQPAGTVLAELVPSNPGWLVVRVDQAERAHTARLAEASREIRARLREQIRERDRDRRLRALYDARRDSLRGPAVRVRYAAIDTVTMNPGAPTAQDLDRYYRGHLADYSSFDPAKGTITEQPFAQVRDEIRTRWMRDRRVELTRSLAERLAEAWSHGRRDAASERAAGGAREVGPLPPGAPADTGLAGAALTDSVRERGGALGVGIGHYARGTLVFHVFQRVPDFLPGFELARPQLEAWRQAELAREDEAGARALFDRDPMKFARGDVLHWTEVRIEPPSFMTMKMTRSEVEQYLRQHLDRYSAPELVRVSHILVSPKDNNVAADRAARARADSLLARIHAGEDFAALARQYSDDEATRDEGGDLGQFGRGTMLEEFERAAFSMRPGDVSGVVHTSVGYHILKCHEYLPAYVQPLALMYSNVSADLAVEKADSAAARRADSVYRSIRTPAQGRATARRLGLVVLNQQHAIGDRGQNAELQAFLSQLDRLRPGQIFPGVRHEKGGGWSLAWVDSLSPPARPTWESARAAAIERYQLGAGERALEAKRAELDSMLASGWTVDSLAALWGGLERMDARPGANLPGLGSRDLDSLLFGRGKNPPALAEQRMSAWIPFPFGVARIRITGRERPDPEQLAARVENERRLEMERNLAAYYETLRKRYAVRILDARLRSVQLPQMPTAMTP